ncbi:MAG: DUF5105 domain-containing protein [Erysipelotrichaceae bacterium]|nr:DUF5105 domain-containing protein [Erysipelotrichaceae bacterium]
MKLFKRICAALLVVMLVVGCQSKPGPTKVVETFLTAVKEKDEEALAEVYEGELSDFDELSSWLDTIIGKLTLTKKQKTALEEVKAAMFDFDYEVLEEEINEDKTEAKVKVQLKTHKFSTIFTKIVQDYLQKMTDLNIKKASKEEKTQAAVDIILNNFKDTGAKSKESSLTLTLKKNDKGKWIVEKLSSAKFNRFKGGINAAIDEFGDVFQ